MSCFQSKHTFWEVREHLFCLKHLCQRVYPRVISFDALKQSTYICAHRIPFSSRKYIILNKLSCFQEKYTFRYVREHLFC